MFIPAGDASYQKILYSLFKVVVYILSKSNKIPLYLQMTDTIMEQIKTGVFKVNDKLPSERELCEIYDISRSTVRQAMSELQRAGCVKTEHGRGNYVVEPIISQPLLSIYSFTAEMIKLGKVPSTKLISFSTQPCGAKVAAHMQIYNNDYVHRFERIRLADNEPVMFVTTYLPVDIFWTLDKDRLAAGSLYEIMAKDFGLTLTRVEEQIQVVSVRRNEARYLGVSESEPAMMIERRSFVDERVIEYAVGIARGDRFRYEVVLNQKKEAV
jgi:GntR family transcriptional regulator